MALALAFITVNVQLRTDAAGSIGRATEAGAPVRHRTESGWRSTTTQQALRNKYLAFLAGKGPKANFALPPNKSNHCKGIAVDVYDDLQEWMVKHGAQYGWTRDKNEEWHFDYNPAKDQSRPGKTSRPTGRALLREVQTALGLARTGRPDVHLAVAWAGASRAQVRNVQSLLGFARTGFKTRALANAWAALMRSTL